MLVDDLIAQAVSAALTSDAIQEKVKKSAEKAVSEAIDQAFGYGSEFRKGLADSISKVLPITREQDLATFAQAVREVVKLRLQTCASETAAEHVGSAIETLLPEERVIYIDEFRKAFLDKIKNDNPEHCDCHGDYEPEHTWEVERPDWSETTRFLYFGSDEGMSRYDAETSSLAFHVKGEIGRCYHAELRHKKDDRHRVVDDVRAIFAGPLYGFHSMLFRLATGLAVLNFGSKPCD